MKQRELLAAILPKWLSAQASHKVGDRIADLGRTVFLDEMDALHATVTTSRRSPLSGIWRGQLRAGRRPLPELATSTTAPSIPRTVDLDHPPPVRAANNQINFSGAATS